MGPQMGSVETGSSGDRAPEEFLLPLRPGHQAREWLASSQPQQKQNRKLRPLLSERWEGGLQDTFRAKFQGGELQNNYRYTSLYVQQVKNQGGCWVYIHNFRNMGNSLWELSSKDTDCEGQQTYSGRSLASEVGQTWD